MPTYQYACTECGERLEAVQSFSDPALTECPVCQGKLRKVFNSVGIVFKGTGFYRNDSRKTPVEASAANDAPKASTPEKSTESKSDSAPAKSSESKSSDSKSSASKSDSKSAPAKPATTTAG